MCDVNLENSAGYTPVMLASLTAPDGPDGMEVVRRLMELGNIHVRSKQVNSVGAHGHGKLLWDGGCIKSKARCTHKDFINLVEFILISERNHTREIKKQ